jgi:Holliday junction resolvase-like predicted endonuclease
MNNKQLVGRIGENIVFRHLKNKGYKILGRNIRLGKFELDIVFMDGDTVVICEVRTVSRLTLNGNSPFTSISVNHETNRGARVDKQSNFRDSSDFISRKKKLNLLRAASVQRFMINSLNARQRRESELRQRVDLFCVEVLADYRKCSIRHFKSI